MVASLRGQLLFRTELDHVIRVHDALREYGPTTRQYDADFWKLKEVGLRYTIPDALANRIGGENAFLLLSAKDVVYLWRAQEHVRTGGHIYDAENGTLGVDGNYGNPFPLSKFTAEVRVSF